MEKKRAMLKLLASLERAQAGILESIATHISCNPGTVQELKSAYYYYAEKIEKVREELRDIIQ